LAQAIPRWMPIRSSSAICLKVTREDTDTKPATHLSVRDFSVVRKDAERGTEFVLALDQFEVRSGDRIGLVGRSGSGKSTILEALGLLVWPDQFAEFKLAGTDLAKAIRARDVDNLAQHRARTIGFIPQDSGLLPYLSVRENAMLAAKLAGVEDAARGKIAAYAKGLGLAALLDRPPSRLSGGETQRAAVLRAMMTGASIILADEPTAALDDETSAEVMTALTNMTNRLGIALICASHDVSLLQKYRFAIHRISHVKDGAQTVALLKREAA